jgi:hypothetical protein
MIEKNFLPLRLSSVPLRAATDAAAENLVRRAAATCVVDHQVLRGDDAAALARRSSAFDLRTGCDGFLPRFVKTPPI